MSGWVFDGWVVGCRVGLVVGGWVRCWFGWFGKVFKLRVMLNTQNMKHKKNRNWGGLGVELGVGSWSIGVLGGWVGFWVACFTKIIR